MFERIKSMIGMNTKESRAWPSILSLGLSGAQWMEENYHAYAREGYIQNADVYACISAGVRAFRGLDWGVYRHKGDDEGRELIPDGPLAELLKQPNARQSFSAIAGEWFGNMEISGNAYIEGVTPGDPTSNIINRPPVELFVLRSDRVKVVVGDVRVPVAGYEYQAGKIGRAHV